MKQSNWPVRGSRWNTPLSKQHKLRVAPDRPGRLRHSAFATVPGVMATSALFDSVLYVLTIISFVVIPVYVLVVVTWVPLRLTEFSASSSSTGS